MPSFRPMRDSKLVIAFSTCWVVGLLTPGSGNAPQMQSAFAGDAFAASAPRSWGRATAPAPAAAEYFRKSRLVTLMSPPGVVSQGPRPSDTDPFPSFATRVRLEATRMVARAPECV